MPISVKCRCGAAFKAQDHLAGKRVKCPKCGDAINVPRPQAAPDPLRPAPAGDDNPLSGLLEEAGVKPVASGPTCPSCNAEMDPTAVICLECGYNVVSGEFLETYVELEEKKRQVGAGGDDKMSDADKIMAKAEADIEDSPVTAKGQDFGDGSDSYVVALGAGAVMSILILVGVVIVLSADYLANNVSLVFVTFIGFLFINFCARIWLAVYGFMEGMGYGLCLLALPITCCGDVFTYYYGFSRGLITPTVLTLVSFIVAVILGAISAA